MRCQGSCTCSGRKLRVVGFLSCASWSRVCACPSSFRPDSPKKPSRIVDTLTLCLAKLLWPILAAHRSLSRFVPIIRPLAVVQGFIILIVLLCDSFYRHLLSHFLFSQVLIRSVHLCSYTTITVPVLPLEPSATPVLVQLPTNDLDRRHTYLILDSEGTLNPSVDQSFIDREKPTVQQLQPNQTKRQLCVSIKIRHQATKTPNWSVSDAIHGLRQAHRQGANCGR